MGHPDPPHGVCSAFPADKFKGKGGAMSAAEAFGELKLGAGLMPDLNLEAAECSDQPYLPGACLRVVSTARPEERAAAGAALSMFTRTTISAQLVGTRCLIATRRLMASSSWMAGTRP